MREATAAEENPFSSLEAFEEYMIDFLQPENLFKILGPIGRIRVRAPVRVSVTVSNR